MSTLRQRVGVATHDTELTYQRYSALLISALILSHLFLQPVQASPTHSSPITLSADGKLVWSVNPAVNTVSVVRTDRDQKIADIYLGKDREPQSVTLTPNGRYAYVANAKSNSVTMIRLPYGNDPDRFSYQIRKEFLTGAEPWNIVASPDGWRVFVANSGQDTVTVIDAKYRKILGSVNLRKSVCNDPDRYRHFQPRGLAVTEDNSKLYVTRFLSFTRAGGKQGDDAGKEGMVCRLDINTRSTRLSEYRPAQAIPLAARVTGFKFPQRDENTLAFPNQLQSIVLRGDQAYLPNIASSPSGPLRFNVDTQAFVSVIDGINGSQATDSGDKFLNLHLGARDPEGTAPNKKKKLFFANVWAMDFTNQSGDGLAYTVAAGSDLLVKTKVNASGKLEFTEDADTTRYIDLNDPQNPNTSGDNAGKNPQGIVIKDGVKAYVNNFVSRNISVVDLSTDTVVKAIRTADLPAPGTKAEVIAVGAEQFFSSRGQYDHPNGAGPQLSLTERLSSEGWQACASCHFKGLTDGVSWKFETGPRKSIPLNATWNPNDRGTFGQEDGDQRILNYSAVRDNVEDFELNTRNISGPGNLQAAVDCSQGPPTQSTFDPNHGLFLGDLDANKPPCVINNFQKSNVDRNQLTVSLPNGGTAVPAQTAMREWVRFAVRTPNAPLTDAQIRGGVSSSKIRLGRDLFIAAGCSTCHGGGNWTNSSKDFKSPPANNRIFCEVNAGATAPTGCQTAPTVGNPVGAQFLAEFLRDVGSFNLGVTDGIAPNPFGNNIGAEEKIGNLVNGAFQDALGFDYNGDGKGKGYNVPSLLGAYASQPFLHNGACESVLCVLNHKPHRIAGQKGGTDVLQGQYERKALAAFVESIDRYTSPVP